MRFRIHHVTRYTYSQPVFLEPHFVRLRPRCDASQHVFDYRLEVTPNPAGASAGLDVENNVFSLLWFDSLYDHLEINVTAEVQTLRTNPYEGFLTDGADRLPLTLDVGRETSLTPYLEPDAKQETSGHESVRLLVDDLLGETQGQTLGFLSQLATRLHRSTEKVTRTEPGIQSPAETLHTKRGACRDLALVFMVACRQVGIPARFVSGYQQGDPDEPTRDLHAWAEVFLPGFGWRGYDPTHGLAVADAHVAVAASALPQNAASITGTFRGTSATSTLEHLITLQTD